MADALRTHGLSVEIHKDHFAADAPDVDWLTIIGRRRWVVLTKDDRIRYRQTEQAAFTAAKVRAFVLTSGNLKAQEMAEAYIKAIPTMARLLGREKGWFIAKVTRAGSVEVVSRQTLRIKNSSDGRDPA